MNKKIIGLLVILLIMSMTLVVLYLFTDNQISGGLAFAGYFGFGLLYVGYRFYQENFPEVYSVEINKGVTLPEGVSHSYMISRFLSTELEFVNGELILKTENQFGLGDEYPTDEGVMIRDYHLTRERDSKVVQGTLFCSRVLDGALDPEPLIYGVIVMNGELTVC